MPKAKPTRPARRSGDGRTTDVICSYAPVTPQPQAAVTPHTLILGTMPSVASLQQREYYAHPRNAFWSIVGASLGFDRAAVPYVDRLKRLADAGFLLWDVLASCERKGSLDADIASEQPNDVVGLLTQYPSVRRVVFNGQPAAVFFRRHTLAPLTAAMRALAGNDAAAGVFRGLPLSGASATAGDGSITLVVAPSTSPAFTLAYDAKLTAWRKLAFEWATL